MPQSTVPFRGGYVTRFGLVDRFHIEAPGPAILALGPRLILTLVVLLAILWLIAFLLANCRLDRPAQTTPPNPMARSAYSTRPLHPRLSRPAHAARSPRILVRPPSSAPSSLWAHHPFTALSGSRPAQFASCQQRFCPALRHLHRCRHTRRPQHVPGTPSRRHSTALRRRSRHRQRRLRAQRLWPRSKASAKSPVRTHVRSPQRRSLHFFQWIVNPIIAGSRPPSSPAIPCHSTPEPEADSPASLQSLTAIGYGAARSPYISSTPSNLHPQQTSQLSIDSPEFIPVVRAIA
jgi:hypothetical protein